ncbi:MAG: hypothetical protein RLZZ200_290 [Pseudomonadota bacterium]|jgi:hypothetical protein
MMPALSQVPVNDVAHAIQLSLAPVFLLNGIGVLLGMLTSRLARVVDRARGLEQRHLQATGEEAGDIVEELGAARRRARLMNFAITLSTAAALLVSLVVALLFTSAFVPVSLATPVSLLFILAMASLVIALLAFLVEIRVATASLRIGPRRPRPPKK